MVIFRNQFTACFIGQRIEIIIINYLVLFNMACFRFQRLIKKVVRKKERSKKNNNDVVIKYFNFVGKKRYLKKGYGNPALIVPPRDRAPQCYSSLQCL